MPITAGQVPAELAALRGIGGDVKAGIDFLVEVTKIINDVAPIWNEIDLTGTQSNLLLAKYDTAKAALKAKVAAF
jgi:hypothetical protein